MIATHWEPGPKQVAGVSSLNYPEMMEFDFDADDSLATLQRFLDYWLGPEEVTPSARVDDQTLVMPEPLRTYLTKIGPRSNPYNDRNLFRCQDVLFDSGQVHVDDQVIVFASENQGVVRWATVPTATADAAVYVDTYEILDIPPCWDKVSDSLRDFITRFCMRELVFEAPFQSVPGFDEWLQEMVSDIAPLLDAYTDDSSWQTPVWLVDDVLAMRLQVDSNRYWYYGAKDLDSAASLVARFEAEHA